MAKSSVTSVSVDEITVSRRSSGRIVVVGNPNSGKSTLFNRLTGLRQQTTNYPGATVEKHVGTATVGEIETKGTVDTPRMRIKLLDPGKNWVKVRILDEDTNRPVPARVHFRSPEGVPYQPHGHHPHLNTNMGT